MSLLYPQSRINRLTADQNRQLAQFLREGTSWQATALRPTNVLRFASFLVFRPQHRDIRASVRLNTRFAAKHQAYL